MGVKGLTRYQDYRLEEILPYIGKVSKKFDVDGVVHKVRMKSQRMLTLGRQRDCQCCGLKATFFALELNGCWSAHLNLYGINEHGHEIMLTVDHIKPRCKGGETSAENLQVLCMSCNQAKGCAEISLEDLRNKCKVGVMKAKINSPRKGILVDQRNLLELTLLDPLSVTILGLNVTHEDFHLYHLHGQTAFIAKEKNTGMYEMVSRPGLSFSFRDFLRMMVHNPFHVEAMSNFMSVKHCLGILKSRSKGRIALPVVAA